ncbi:MAG: 4Fe-4S binding protein [Candidatus Latescibacteria bacterium]|nr:4Fe-4S binding protein [Candidatus Latescibacterota bacterium]
MLRKIVRIDEEKCNGCGICVTACAEGALKIIDGKARLVSEIYCDGLGACLGKCPQDAITIEEREADEFDELATEKYLKKSKEKIPQKKNEVPISGGCPGSALRSFITETGVENTSMTSGPSQLSHWPVQLTLVPPTAPFLKEADIVVCADCVPFALPDIHSRYLKNRVVLVGCPKLDDLSFYQEKLIRIFETAQPSSITVLRMEVPCCGGIAHAAIEARKTTIPDCPLEIHIISIRGKITKEHVKVKVI